MDCDLRFNRAVLALLLGAALALTGCQTGSGSNQLSSGSSSTSLVAQPNAVTFGDVQIGQHQTQSVILANTGSASVNITGITSPGAGFSLNGLSVPTTLAAGQTVSVQVDFKPISVGMASTNAVINSTAMTSTLFLPLSGNGVSSSATAVNAIPSSVIFGTIPIGKSDSRSLTLTNSNSASATISQITVSGSDFTLTGPSLPLTLAAGDSANIDVVFAPQLDGTSSGFLTVTETNVSAALTIPLSGIGSSATSGTAAGFMGMDMHGGIITRQPWPAEPIGSVRLWDCQVSWAEVNPAPETFDFTSLDKWLAKIADNDVDALYTFGRTPAWASSNPGDASCGFAPGACDPPKDLNPDGTGPDALWKNFITAIATHNLNSPTGHIQFWEIWNEAGNPPTWKGTVQQTVRMAKDAREIILGIDSSAVIVSPSVIIEGRPARDFLRSFLQSGGADAVDAIAFHGYVQKNGSPLLPESIVGYLDSTKSILAAQAQSAKPMFDTEVSWGDPSVSTPAFNDTDMRIGFVARIILLQWSSGVARSYWYQWNNSSRGTMWVPDSNNPSAPGTVLPTGIAYGEVYNWIIGATLTSPCSAGGTVWTCQITRPGGYSALAVWDTSKSCSGGVCTTTAYTFDPTYTNSRDLAGNAKTLVGTTVRIGAKPILLENQ